MITTQEEQQERIAIIGMAGRFPGASDLQTFWDNLRHGVESIRTFTDEELHADGISTDLVNDPFYVKASGFLKDFDQFDASFFQFSPREAEIIDPQQRIFLECVWEALEDAGCASDNLSGSRIGVYAGAGLNNYFINHLAKNPKLLDLVGAEQVRTGNRPDNLATRISYKLDFRGPSMTVQTSCSTSLVALHLACLSLLTYQSDIAVAGGVTVSSLRREGYIYQEAGIRSPDGHCRAFDADARGTVGGNGAGVVILKRLSDAQRDADNIRAIILGSAINNDGAAKVGYTAPGVEGQASAIREALANSGITPESIGYVEAHGTGTALGDPIEVKALTEAFGDVGHNYCGLGSVKTNIGHLDAAAGIAGLIKTVLSLENEEIPATLHYKQPNPEIDFKASPFFVVDQLRPWPKGKIARRAGVSSFGMGGTNAHVVLEEAPSPAKLISRVGEWQVLPLAARSEAALEQLSLRVADHIEKHPELDLADVAHTLQVGRRHFACRRAIVCNDRVGAIEALNIGAGSAAVRPVRSRYSKVAFLLSGLGDQHLEMAHGLYLHDQYFRSQLDRCNQILSPLLKADLTTILYPPHPVGPLDRSPSRNIFQGLQRQTSLSRPTREPSLLDQTRYSHPALFALEYSLGQLWMHWGITPSYLLGHSLGEYVAACLAGVFSLEDALRLVAERADLIQAAPSGAMLAVLSTQDQIKDLLLDGVVVSAINAPEICVLSGPVDDILDQEQRFLSTGIGCRRVEADHAFHSQHMLPIVDQLEGLIAKIPRHQPTIPLLSNLTGRWLTAEEACSSRYWAAQMCSTVRFADCVSELLQKDDCALLEIGPARNLTAFAKLCAPPSQQVVAVASLPEPDANRSDLDFILESVGRLWENGIDINWRALRTGVSNRIVSLPTYPFEHQRYLIERGSSQTSSEQPSPGKKSEENQCFTYTPSWRQSHLRVSAKGLSVPPKGCLIFTNGDQLTSALCELLERQGHSLVSVSTGSEFQVLAESKFAVAADDPEDFRSLAKHLSDTGFDIDRIVYGWSIEPQPPEDNHISAVRALERTYHGLIQVAQAFGEHFPNQPIHIVIPTNSVHRVCGEVVLNPLAATAAGPCLVIPQEFPAMTCSSIDIVMPTDKTELALLATALLDETLHPDEQERLVAYRDGIRWVRGYSESVLGGETDDRLEIRESGVYLITGGTGGIGLEIARHFAKKEKVRLALLSRSAFPPRERWEQIIQSPEGREDLALRARIFRDIEALGSEILTIQANVADRLAMTAAISQITEVFGPINGVVHSAGVAGGGVIALQSKKAAEAVFESKVYGTMLLSDLLEGSSLDFMVLCSSHRALFGGIGRVDYCSANSFLDAFALKRRFDGASVTSINWDTWRESGMAVETAARMGIDLALIDASKGISSKAALQALDKALTSSLAQIIVTGRPIKSLIESESKRGAVVPTPPSRTGSVHARPKLDTEYVPPRNDTESLLVTIWQELLGIDRIGINDNFFELGGDSVISLRIGARANQAGLKLLPRQIFQHQTVATLAASNQHTTNVDAEQGILCGPVELSPMQYVFFERRKTPNINFFNQSVLLEVAERLEFSALRASLRRVMLQHDSLRTRFRKKDGGWEQYLLGEQDTPGLNIVNVETCDPDAQSRVVESFSPVVQTSLDLVKGPVFRATYFDFGPDSPGRLLLVTHHSLIDILSWPILVQDLECYYGQLRHGRRTEVPPKTTSFRSWTSRLTGHAQSEAVLRNSSLWLSDERRASRPLRKDFPDGINNVASVDQIQDCLTVAETRALLQEIPKRLKVSAQDAMLYALTVAASGASEGGPVLVTVEGHGREPLFPDVDLSRTVGWFTSHAPYLLCVEEGQEPAIAVAELAHQIRLAPYHGIEYGLLRYLSNDHTLIGSLASQPEGSIKFLYMGQLDQVRSSSSLFRPAREDSGATQHPEMIRTHDVDVSVGILGGQMRVSWAYSRNIHLRSTIEQINTCFIRALRRLMNRDAASELDVTNDNVLPFGWSIETSNQILTEIQLQTN